MSLFSKIFGTYSEKQVKKLTPVVNKIEALAGKYSAMSDDEMQAQTPILKQRLANGETLDDILPDAFALVREAADRVLGTRHYRVQLIGGIIIHQGRIAEMKTGEGKTQVATLPAYLNALTGKGVHVVTVNDYLAKRDSEWMGKLYNYLGLSVGLIVHGLTNEQRKAAYAADITYGTNNEMGFDYLRDNMVIYKDRIVQRGHEFAIVDEVDSILIDEARTPLIISGIGDESDELYKRTNDLVKRMTCFRIKEIDAKVGHDDIDADYIVDEKAKTAVLGKSGIKKAEQYFGIENLADGENMEYMHYLDNAIRAYGVMQRDVDYVVKDGQVLIVDSFTGRIMPGRRYSNGLHQAIEAKENCKIERENKTQATITFQNYFRMYKKLSGMTGTALTEETEFREIYSLDVVEIPTNKPVMRRDMNDLVYKTMAGKYHAIINQIRECHEKGQPVLVGTVSIDKSELLSDMLKREGIKHNVLNAKLHEREAEIVAQAGMFGAVTISTNMAGRGTDIKLGGNSEFLAKQKMRDEGCDEDEIAEATSYAHTNDPVKLELRERFRKYEEELEEKIKPEAEKVRAAGGLFIIGTERHESRRIDNQLRGRSGRQGDPGASRFYLSMQDDLMRLFGSDRILSVVEAMGLPEDQPIDAKILSSSIESAQKRLEGQNFERRKNVLQYDDVMNRQRELIYGERQAVLNGEDLRDKIHKMMYEYIDDGVSKFCSSHIPDEWNIEGLRGYFRGVLCGDDDFRYSIEELEKLNTEAVSDMLKKRADERYAAQEELFGNERFREIERIILLENVDRKWVDHIDAMDDLISGVGLNAYAQRNPISEYKIVGSQMFDEMIENIRTDTVRMLLCVVPRRPIERKQVMTAANDMNVGGEKKITVVKTKAQKVGPNDPCPCGSGLKYKKCCMGKEK
ncbi:MAG: preprotein translocase subunit SecA [Eubacteriales bacterium]|nr:preprotein translocase subunit SecA [Ruminococcus sp.]MDY2743247.1 preprotein translocase subunit SecA [Eubacteriales bacterium]